MKTSLPLSASLILLTGILSVKAIDPLPPELDSAPLDKQAEYWQRTSRESGELRTKVAQERYDANLVYKRALQAQMEENLALVEARLEIPGAGPGVIEAAQEDEGGWKLYVLLGGLLIGGAAFINQQMKTSEQPV